MEKIYLSKKLHLQDVYLVFDRYFEYSTKDSTRSGRYSNSTSYHQLTEETLLPPQKTILGNVRNKVQLISLIVKSLVTDEHFHATSTTGHNLIVTGHDSTPVEISDGEIILDRRDMISSHEEADVLLIHQLIAVRETVSNSVLIISGDTDVFVLLLTFCKKYNLSFDIFMESPVKDRSLIDIKKTIERHENIISELLPAHAISGCDTVACLFGIGKGAVIKALRRGFKFKHIGNQDSCLDDVSKEATEFIVSCYGIKTAKTMSEARLYAWSSKAGKSVVTCPKLEALPPTTEAFLENVKRGHLQACVWSSADRGEPPDMSPEKFGFMKDQKTNSLKPVLLPVGVALAPDYVLNLIKCNCQAMESACSSRRCKCRAAGMYCTMFCGCRDRDCTNIEN